MADQTFRVVPPEEAQALGLTVTPDAAPAAQQPIQQVDPLQVFTDEELVKDPHFKPTEYWNTKGGDALPLETTQRLNNIWLGQNKQGVTMGDVVTGVKNLPSTLGEMGKGLLHYAYRAAGPVVQPLLGAVDVARGMPLADVAAQRGKKLLGQQAEMFAAIETGATGLGEMATKAGGAAARGVRLDTPWAQMTTGESLPLFLEAAHRQKQIESVTKGEGATFGPAITPLKEMGVEIDQEAVAAMSSVEPLTFIAMGAGFGLINKAGQIVMRGATKAGITQAAAKMAASGRPVFANIIDKTAQATGAALEATGTGVRATAPFAGGVAGGLQAGPVAAYGGWKIGQKVGTKLDAALKATGGAVRQAGTGAANLIREGVTTRGGMAAADLLAKPAIGAAHGLGYDLLLNWAASDTAGEAQERPLGIGAVFGVYGGLKAGAKSLVQRELTAPSRASLVDPGYTPYGEMPALDAVHESAMGAMPPSLQGAVNLLRGIVAPDGGRIFVMPSQDAFAAALVDAARRQGKEITPQLEAMAKQQAAQSAMFFEDVAAPDGTPRRVIFVNDVNSGLVHDVGHIFQAALGEAANRKVDALMGQRTSNAEFNAFAKRYVEQFLGRPLKAGETVQSVLEPYVPAEFKGNLELYMLREMGAEHFDTLFRNKGGDIAGKSDGLRTAAEVIGSVMEEMGDAPLAASQGLQAPMSARALTEFQAQLRAHMSGRQQPAAPAQPAAPGAPTAPPTPAPAGAPTGRPSDVWRGARVRAANLDRAAGWLVNQPADVQAMVQGVIDATNRDPNATPVFRVRRESVNEADLMAPRSQRRAEQVEAYRKEQEAAATSQEALDQMNVETRRQVEDVMAFIKFDLFNKGTDMQFVGADMMAVSRNANRLAKMIGALDPATRAKVKALIPYEISEPRVEVPVVGRGPVQVQAGFTPEAWHQLVSDYQSYVKNQNAGWKGGGEGRVVAPANAAQRNLDLPPVREGYQPVVLGRVKERFLNLINGEPIVPETAKASPRKGGPANLAGQDVAAANLGDIVDPVIRPRQTGRSKGQVQMGPEQFKETNTMRNDLLREGVKVGELEQVIKRIDITQTNADTGAQARHVKEITPLPGSPFAPRVTDVVRGGFRPQEGELIGGQFKPATREDVETIRAAAIRDRQTGEMFSGFMHAMARDQAMERHGWTEDSFPADRYEDGFLAKGQDTAMRFVSRDEATPIALRAGQVRDKYERTLREEGAEGAQPQMDSDYLTLEAQYSPAREPAVTKEVQELMKMTVEERVRAFSAFVPNERSVQAGGLTGMAYDIGRRATTREDLLALEVGMEMENQAFKDAMAAKDFDVAMQHASSKQFFREAYEAATGTKSAGEFLRKRDPNYQPPMPNGVEGQMKPRAKKTEDKVPKGYSTEGYPVSDVRANFGPGADMWLSPEGYLYPVPRNQTHGMWMMENQKKVFKSPLSEELTVDNAPYFAIDEGWTRVAGDADKVFFTRETLDGSAEMVSAKHMDIAMDVAEKTGKPVVDSFNETIVNPRGSDEGMIGGLFKPSTREDVETIRAAATRAGGKTYTGLMHAMTHEELATKLSEADRVKLEDGVLAGVEDGFVTSTGRFVDRNEAAAIAEKSGQRRSEFPEDALIAEELVEPGDIRAASEGQFAPRRKYSSAPVDPEKATYGPGAAFWLSPGGDLYPLPRGQIHEQWAAENSKTLFGKEIKDTKQAYEAAVKAGWARVNNSAIEQAIVADRRLGERDLGVSRAQRATLETVGVQSKRPVQDSNGREILPDFVRGQAAPRRKADKERFNGYMTQPVKAAKAPFGFGADYWLSPDGELFPVPRGMEHANWAQRSSKAILNQEFTNKDDAYIALVKAGWTRLAPSSDGGAIYATRWTPEETFLVPRAARGTLSDIAVSSKKNVLDSKGKLLSGFGEEAAGLEGQLKPRDTKRKEIIENLRTEEQAEQLRMAEAAQRGQFSPRTDRGRELEKKGFTFQSFPGEQKWKVTATSPEGNVVGTIDLRQFLPGQAHVREAYVKPRFRRQGLGTALYDEAAALLKDNDIKELTGLVVEKGPLEIREKVFGKEATRLTTPEGDPISMEEAKSAKNVEVYARTELSAPTVAEAKQVQETVRGPARDAMRSNDIPAGEAAEVGVGGLFMPKGDVEAWAQNFKNDPEVQKTFSARDIENFLSGVRRTAAILGKDPATLAAMMPKEVGGDPFRENSDKLFKLTFDLTTVCPQQDAHVATVRALEREQGRILTPDERFAVGQMMHESGVSPACWYCYGQSGRDKFDSMISRVSRSVEKTMELGTWNPKAVEEMIGKGYKTTASVQKLSENWASVRSGKGGDYYDLMTGKRAPANKGEQKVRNAYERAVAGVPPEQVATALKEFQSRPMDPVALRDHLVGERKLTNLFDKLAADEVAGYAQAASFANQPKGYAPYWRGVLDTHRAELLELNKSAGARLNSQSDFRSWHILDTAAMLSHLQAIGGMAHVYTRQPEFVRVFGKTGIKFNLSTEWIDPVGLPRNARFDALTEAQFNELHAKYGDPDWGAMNSVPKDVSMRLREENSNVGTMLVALNDYQLWKALGDADIDMIIPFHRGQVEKGVTDFMGAKDYSREQHEHYPEGWFGERTVELSSGRKVTLDVGKIKVDGKDKQVFPAITREHHQNSKADYLELTEKFGITPRFERFKGHDGYMKLVRDVSRNPSEQTPIDVTKIDWKEAARLTDAFVTEEASRAKREAIGENPDLNNALLREIKARLEEGNLPKTDVPAKEPQIRLKKTTAKKVGGKVVVTDVVTEPVPEPVVVPKTVEGDPEIKPKLTRRSKS